MATRMQQGGFTLVELMIVVVILGIITTIAVQQFNNTGQDGARATVLTELSSLNEAVARYYQGNFTYTGANDVANKPVTAVRGQIKQSQYYTVTLLIPTAQSYYLVASPTTTGIMKGKGAYSVSFDGKRCFYPTKDSPDPVADAALCTKSW